MCVERCKREQYKMQTKLLTIRTATQIRKQSLGKSQKKMRPKQAKNENSNDAEGHKMDATVVKCNSTVTMNVKVPSDFVDECNKTGRLIMICWKVHDCCIAQFVSHSLAKNTFFEDTRIL